jgi:hypothetical protein
MLVYCPGLRKLLDEGIPTPGSDGSIVVVKGTQYIQRKGDDIFSFRFQKMWIENKLVNW